MKKQKARVERALKNLREITDEDVEFEEESSRELLQSNEYQVGTPERLNVLATGFRGPLFRGCQQIAVGKSDGWNDIFGFARIRVLGLGKVSTLHSDLVHDLAPDLLLLEGYESAKDHREAGDALLGYLFGKRVIGKSELHLAYFAGWIHTTLQGGSFEGSPPKGPLAALARHGLEAELPTAAVTEVCAFQLENGGEKEKDGVEFVDYQLIPIWWQALRQLRTSRGLETRVPDHPLFASPFAKMPTKAPAFDSKKDPAIQAILKASKALGKKR